jgi:hypothetical protein
MFEKYTAAKNNEKCAAAGPVLRAFIMAVPALASMVVACSAWAESERSDIFIQGGALRGRESTTWTYEGGFISKRSEHFGLGFAYLNEGHLLDNHRDGLAAQGWYLLPFGNDFEVQIGTGPYATMNNTTIDGTRENRFKLGLLSSVALKWHPTSDPWYLRAQYNNAWVPGSFYSNAVLLGVGRDFDYQGEDYKGKLNTDVSFWGGSSRTTQIGVQNTAIAYELETKFHVDSSEHFAWSVGLLSEGDTNLANRRGVPVRLWYDQPATDRLTFSIGVGPYVAYDGINHRKLEVIGVGSLRVTFRVIGRYEAGVMYTRVASFYNRDQDIVMIGLLAHL